MLETPRRLHEKWRHINRNAPSGECERGAVHTKSEPSAFYPRRRLRGKQMGLDILACGSSYSPRLLSLMANGTLRFSSPLTATGSRRSCTGLPETPTALLCANQSTGSLSGCQSMLCLCVLAMYLSWPLPPSPAKGESGGDGSISIKGLYYLDSLPPSRLPGFPPGLRISGLRESRSQRRWRNSSGGSSWNKNDSFLC